MAVVSVALDSHGNTIKIQNGKKVRTLLAGYTFIGLAPLCFQTVPSCPLRGLFSIGSETKQLTCFPFKFTLFNNHNSNKNNHIFTFIKLSKLYSKQI